MRRVLLSIAALALAPAAMAFSFDDPDCMRQYEGMVNEIVDYYAELKAGIDEEFRGILSQYPNDPQLEAALRYERDAAVANLKDELAGELASLEADVCYQECDPAVDPNCCVDANGDGICDQ